MTATFNQAEPVYYKLEDIDTAGNSTFYGHLATQSLTDRQDPTPVPALTAGALLAGRVRPL